MDIFSGFFEKIYIEYEINFIISKILKYNYLLSFFDLFIFLNLNFLSSITFFVVGLFYYQKDEF